MIKNIYNLSKKFCLATNPHYYCYAIESHRLRTLFSAQLFQVALGYSLIRLDNESICLCLSCLSMPAPVLSYSMWEFLLLLSLVILAYRQQLEIKVRGVIEPDNFLGLETSVEFTTKSGFYNANTSLSFEMHLKEL